MGFFRQDYWSRLPFLPPRDLPDPGTEPASFMSPALAGGFFTTIATWEAPCLISRPILKSELQTNCLVNNTDHFREFSLAELYLNIAAFGKRMHTTHLNFLF